MQSAVIVFPGSNCDRDMAVALEKATGKAPAMIWHKETTLPAGLDLIALPGGFSFGDYLRCGAIAARAPIMRAVMEFAQGGGLVLGVCNGFQILIETGLLPGALMRNRGLKFICRDVHLRVETTESPFTCAYAPGAVIRIPIAHHDGNYVVDAPTLQQLHDEARIAFRYCHPDGQAGDNPNGATDAIAGVLGPNRRVLGLMPHPERLNDPVLGGDAGARLFDSLVQSLAPRMKSAPIFALALLLAGCAGQTPPTQTAQNAPKPTIVHFSHPDGRQFLEELAARCWLDRVLHGAAMLVGRESGRIIVTDDQTRLLTAEFVFSDAGQNKIALYGPAMETPQTRDLLLRTLENAAKSGETSCPETS